MKPKKSKNAGAEAAKPPEAESQEDVPQTEAEAEAWRKRKKQEAAFDHTTALAVSLYAHQLKSLTGKDCKLDKSQTAFVVDLWERFRPRDPVEEMLFMQMIQTHCRHMYVSSFASQQHNLKWAGMMYDAAERAANTFRRQTLALAECRRPPAAQVIHRHRPGQHRPATGRPERACGGRWSPKRKKPKRKRDERKGIAPAPAGPTG